jgi:hypothetical protein
MVNSFSEFFTSDCEHSRGKPGVTALVEEALMPEKRTLKRAHRRKS